MKIPNESDRISHDHLTIVRKPKAAAGYIEGLKEAILSRNLAVGQRINQRGLTRVRVSNDRKDGKGLPKSTRPALVLVSGDILDVLFPVRDAIADATAIGFQFGFPGPLVPMPPPRRDIAVPFPESRGRRYLSWASSTCTFPSLVWARLAKICRMS